jgi:xanthine dehydrogenase molybdopterin-binding subunit B
MKTVVVLGIVVGATLLSTPAQAKDVSQTATVVAMNSVPCGTKGERHKKTREMLCHEYVLRSGSTEYHIQQKEEKSSDVLAIGGQATFTIHKDQMRLHAANISGKEKDYEFVVVSMKSAEETKPSSTPHQ